MIFIAEILILPTIVYIIIYIYTISDAFALHCSWFSSDTCFLLETEEN